jgi:hypothetical protein
VTLDYGVRLHVSFRFRRTMAAELLIERRRLPAKATLFFIPHQLAFFGGGGGGGGGLCGRLIA